MQQLASGGVTSLTHVINTFSKIANFRINSLFCSLYQLQCERQMLPVAKTGPGIQKTATLVVHGCTDKRSALFILIFKWYKKQTGEQICYSKLGFLMTDITNGAGKWREAPYLLHFPTVCYIPSVQWWWIKPREPKSRLVSQWHYPHDNSKAISC